MDKRVFKFYSDPGHGWLEVDRDDLRELSLEDSISGFSYQDDSKVYLEEDCDASLFLREYEAKYGKMSYTPIYRENIFIRDLNSYRRGGVGKFLKRY